MPREVSVIGEILRRVYTREGAEVVDEVSLVEVTAIEGHTGPIHGLAAGDGAQDFLKTAHTAEEFRRHSDVLLEEFDEAARTEAGLAGHFGDPDHGGLRDEVLHGVLDHRLAVEHAGGALEQRQFQYAQLGSR